MTVDDVLIIVFLIVVFGALLANLCMAVVEFKNGLDDDG